MGFLKEAKDQHSQDPFYKKITDSPNTDFRIVSWPLIDLIIDRNIEIINA